MLVAQPTYVPNVDPAKGSGKIPFGFSQAGKFLSYHLVLFPDWKVFSKMNKKRKNSITQIKHLLLITELCVCCVMFYRKQVFKKMLLS